MALTVAPSTLNLTVLSTSLTVLFTEAFNETLTVSAFAVVAGVSVTVALLTVTAAFAVAVEATTGATANKAAAASGL